MSSEPNQRTDRPAPQQWLKSNLVGLGSAAVLAVYAAGFERTKAAAARFNEEAAGRRSAAPIRTTGEIGALTPRVPDSTHAAAPAPASSPKASSPQKSEALAKAEPASKTTAVKPESTTTTEKHAADAVAPPPAVVAQAPTPARDSTPPEHTLAKALDMPSAPKPAPDTAKQESEVPRKDGSYTGWGTSRHGDIQATVQIKDGKIIFAAITECLTRYSCSWIAPLPPQVLARQSAEVDIVSGATESTNAFYYAVLEALKKAK